MQKKQRRKPFKPDRPMKKCLLDFHTEILGKKIMLMEATRQLMNSDLMCIEAPPTVFIFLIQYRHCCFSYRT